MTFRGLPDPERYTHPRLSWLIEYLFDVVLGRMFRVEHDMADDPRVAPGTLVMCNHLRDADAPLVGRLLFHRKGFRLRGRLPYFAMREDLFQREGLANLLPACPPPLSRLLAGIPLGWLFAHVRTLPMRRVREFTWHDTLRALVRTGQGKADPARVFNGRGRRELAACLGGLPDSVDAIDPWRLGHLRTARWGLRRLSPRYLRIVGVWFRAGVRRQLARFAHLLAEGHSVFFAPEGGISPDGRLGRMRAGACGLLAMTASPPPVVCFVLSYDPLGPGRTRVLVRREAWSPGATVSCPGAFSAALATCLRRHRVVTPSHLLATYLVCHPQPFGVARLTAWMQQAGAAVREAGYELDPLLTRGAMPALVEERLRWLRRRRLVRCRRGVWHNAWPRGAAPSWWSAAGQVRFLANALADFAPDAVRRFPA